MSRMNWGDRYRATSRPARLVDKDKVRRAQKKLHGRTVAAIKAGRPVPGNLVKVIKTTTIKFNPCPVDGCFNPAETCSTHQLNTP